MISSKTYAQKLRDPRWQRLRLKRLEASGWKCDHCGDSRNELQVHHKWYLKNMEPWDYEVHNLESLCVTCHEKAGKVHEAIKAALAVLPLMEQQHILAILARINDRDSDIRHEVALEVHMLANETLGPLLGAEEPHRYKEYPQRCSFTRYGEPSGYVNQRVAACFAVAVSKCPSLARAVLEMHDHKGLLSISSSRVLFKHEGNAIRESREDLGEDFDAVEILTGEVE